MVQIVLARPASTCLRGQVTANVRRVELRHQVVGVSLALHVIGKVTGHAQLHVVREIVAADRAAVGRCSPRSGVVLAIAGRANLVAHGSPMAGARGRGGTLRLCTRVYLKVTWTLSSPLWRKNQDGVAGRLRFK
jgi:hypothetical protein